MSTVDQTWSQNSLLRIKPVYKTLYLDGRILVNNGIQESFEIEDLDGYFKRLFKSLDGRYTVKEVYQMLKDIFSYQELQENIQLLNDNGILEDTNLKPNPLLQSNDLDRYSANINLFSTFDRKEQSPYDYQARLKKSQVLLFGLGGIGSNVCMSLAELGVGKIVAVDYDKIELSNLNRQVLYSTKNIGQFKTKVAKQKIMEFNPDINFTVINQKIDSLQAVTNIIEENSPEFVFCLADKPNGFIDFWINEACVTKDIPMVAASIGCSTGTAYSVNLGHSCYQCRVDHDLGNDPKLAEQLQYIRENEVNASNGALGSSCMFLAYFLSNEFLRYQLDIGPFLTQDKLFEINFLTFEQTYHEMPRQINCTVCGDEAHS